jgi:hypothetical protein
MGKNYTTFGKKLHHTLTRFATGTAQLDVRGSDACAATGELGWMFRPAFATSQQFERPSTQWSSSAWSTCHSLPEAS